MMILRPIHGERGTSLIELMVSALLFSLVAAGGMRFLVLQHQWAVRQEDAAEAQQQARAAVDFMGRELGLLGFGLPEGDTKILKASGQEVEFLANLHAAAARLTETAQDGLNRLSIRYENGSDQFKQGKTVSICSLDHCERHVLAKDGGTGDLELEQGVTRVFHEVGGVALEAFYLDDKLEGEVKIYDIGGSVRVIDNYINGEMINRVRFDFMGKLESEERTDKNYFDNGSLNEEIFIKNGRKENSTKIYYPSGFLKEEWFYENDTLQGRSFMYYENGVVKSSIDYINGIQQGITRNYYDNGIMESEINYEDGIKNGIAVTYYDNGVLKSSLRYLNDIIEGSSKTFYDIGLLKAEENYDDGKLHGLRKEYYMNGAVKEEQNYIYGKINGWAKSFFRNGKINKEEYYENGVLKRSKEYDSTGLLVSTSGY